MKVETLWQRPGEWLRPGGPEGDVVLSTRLRLARNLESFKFLTVAKGAERRRIEQHIRERLAEALPKTHFFYVPLHEADPLDKQMLLERHLISNEMANGEGERGVAVAVDETAAIMVNEEDHLRIQVIRAGFRLEDAFAQLVDLDRRLERVFPYAFHSRYGYLTCCPTNLGTGLRVSVMLHLPAGVYTKQMERVLASLAQLSFTVRGFYGEGTQPIGDLFQVSNQAALGKSEEEILEEMRQAVPQLVAFERAARARLWQEQPERVEDKIWRAYGILSHARTITSEEALELLSALRLGVCLERVKDITMERLNEMFLMAQPAHLQKAAGQPLDPAKRDAFRAKFLRERMTGNGSTKK